MQNKPKLTVSGYRGVWGETLDKKIIEDYTIAFLNLVKEKEVKPKILIGRDGRESGPQIKEIIINKLSELEIETIDGDILPTPTIIFAVRKHKYDGAIIITASHNPIEYNGLKFINKEAMFLNDEEIKKINNYLYANS